MTGYAAGTKVSRTQTGAEIERILTRFGASKFAAGWEQDHGFITFVYGSRTVSTRTVTIRVPMPDRNHSAFTLTPSTKRPRSASAAEAAYNQAVRARWRALALVVKAMLVAVDAGIFTFEDAFLGYTVLPGGVTVSQHLLPYVNRAIEDGHLPALPAETQARPAGRNSGPLVSAGVPILKLTCRGEAEAARLAALVTGRGYFGVSTEGAEFLMPWGGPADRVFPVGEWAVECGFADDLEVSEFFMQAAGHGRDD